MANRRQHASHLRSQREVKVNTYRCNICRYQIPSSIDDEIDGLSLSGKGPIGAEYSQFVATVRATHGDIHICASCVKALGNFVAAKYTNETASPQL
jgi:hypothetical protein